MFKVVSSFIMRTPFIVYLTSRLPFMFMLVFMFVFMLLLLLLLLLLFTTVVVPGDPSAAPLIMMSTIRLKTENIQKLCKTRVILLGDKALMVG